MLDVQRRHEILALNPLAFGALGALREGNAVEISMMSPECLGTWVTVAVFFIALCS